MTKKVEDKLQSKSLNELQVKITSATDQELINEKGRTIVTMLMQEDGRIMTSFLGDYNKEILKTFKRVNRVYFNKLYKELIKNKNKNKEENNKNQSNASAKKKDNKKKAVKNNNSQKDDKNKSKTNDKNKKIKPKKESKPK